MSKEATSDVLEAIFTDCSMESILQQILELKLDNLVKLQTLVHVLFEKGVNHSDNEVYVQICKKLLDMHIVKQDEKYYFRFLFYEKCNVKNTNLSEKDIVKNTVKFLTKCYNADVLPSDTITAWMLSLQGLDQNDSLECLCLFLIGAGSKLKEEGVNLCSIITHIKEVIKCNKKKISKKVEELLQKTLDLEVVTDMQKDSKTTKDDKATADQNSPQTLDNLQFDNLCKICDKELTEPEAHYRSRKHISKFKAWLKGQDIPKKELWFCNTCEEPLCGTPAAKSHYKNAEHKRKEELYCDICSLRTLNQDHNHIHRITPQHRNNLRDKNLTEMFIDGEYVYCDRQSDDDDYVDDEEMYWECDNCKEHAIENPHMNIAFGSAPKDLTNVAEMSSYYCYICKIDFKTPEEMNIHSSNMVHLHLLVLATLLAKDKFNLIYDKDLNKFRIFIDECEKLCLLCNAKVSNVTSYKEHFQSKKHTTQTSEWINNHASMYCSSSPYISARWVYCQICQLSFDGTTNAKEHYLTEEHKRLAEIYKDPDENVETNNEIKENEHAGDKPELEDQVSKMKISDNQK